MSYLCRIDYNCYMNGIALKDRFVSFVDKFRVKEILSYTTAFWVALLVGCLITLLSMWNSLDLDSMTLDSRFHLELSLPMNILMSLAIYIYCFKLFRIDQQKWVRVIFAIVGSLMLAVMFSLLTALLSHWIYEGVSLSRSFSINAIKDASVALVSVLLVLLLGSMSSHYRLEMEVEQLKSTNALVSYDALQKQLDPHFLFNSLTTLDSLIGHDDARAKEYLQHLATTFRSSANNNGPTTLKEEMEFANAYKYIMTTRYQDSLTVEEKIAPERMSDYVVHFSVQLLLENVVKHNVISERHPMHVVIETTDHDTLRVSNPLQPYRNRQQQGSHLGLENLRQRYQILFRRELIIEKTEEMFAVEIPLVSAEEARAAVESKLKVKN